jgi:nicotinate-nucleotide adenylyltransferase
MKVAIFGGSFDPVHLGHLWAAQGCAEQLRLDQVIFMPTATSPLKPGGAVASGSQRATMVQLALGGMASTNGPADGGVAMVVDEREIRRGGASYTVDTVAELKQERPDDAFFLLLGSDAFASIRLWHRPSELLEMITPVVFRRGGDPPTNWTVLETLLSPTRAAEIRQCGVTLPMIEISSSSIRQRVAKGRSIRFLVPHAVAAYIHAEALYR